MTNKKLMLAQVFTEAQLNLIYDALNDYQMQADCIDEDNGDTECSDLLDSVMNIIVDTE